MKIDTLLKADNHSAEDLPEYEDSATVSDASDRSYSLASHWLRDCLANHSLCNQTSDADFEPPTRVIDIGIRDGKYVPRLYLTSKQDVNMKYIALSHCWGKIKPAILQKHMLRNMTCGIDWLQLPRTFQDAMIVTLRLGFHYLWIDSLCIIQDCQEDWSKESGTMQNVYANCVLTIAASWGKDSGSGLFIERKPLNQQPCRIFGNACTGTYIETEHINIRKSARFLNEESLEKRAWAVQEQFLPPRILSYRSFELQWDCLESRGSESWPTGLRGRAKKVIAKRQWQYRPENTAFREISSLKARRARFDLDDINNFYAHWDDILQRYTKACLTFQSDVFVALSGLTKSIEKWTGLTNIFGLWKELLPIDLLWERWNTGVDDATRSLLYPTWSWGSLVGTESDLVTFSDWRYLSSVGFEEKWPAPVKSRVMSLDPPSAASESNMRIEIQGPTFCTNLMPPSDGWLSGYPPTLQGIKESYCLFDFPGEHVSVENVFCLVIIKGQRRNSTSVSMGLILARPKHEKEEYIRIGVWRQILGPEDNLESHEEDIILNAKERTIFLI